MKIKQTWLRLLLVDKIKLWSERVAVVGLLLALNPSRKQPRITHDERLGSGELLRTRKAAHPSRS